MEAWPTRLKRLRTATRLSQARVADALGIKPSSVAQWEIGRSKPSLDRLPTLAELYQVSLSDLCGTDLGTPDSVRRVVLIDQTQAASETLGPPFSSDGPYTESELALIELWRDLSPETKSHFIGLMEAVARNAA